MRTGHQAIWLVTAALLVAGCGGGDDDGGSDVASIDDVEQCIKDEGLDVSRQQAIGPGETGSLQIPVGNRNVINVGFYDNEDDAKNYEDDSKHFTDQAGGEVKRRGKVVYTVLKEGNDEEFKKVEDCL